jgi:hypothetical protein
MAFTLLISLAIIKQFYQLKGEDAWLISMPQPNTMTMCCAMALNWVLPTRALSARDRRIPDWIA